MIEHKRPEKEIVEKLDELWHELAEEINKRVAAVKSKREQLLSTDKEYPAWIPAPIKNSGFLDMMRRCDVIK